MKPDRDIKLILNQEHQAHGPVFTDLQYEAERLGWSMIGALATRTVKEGSSAGVADGIGIGHVAGRFDFSPIGPLGRVAAA